MKSLLLILAFASILLACKNKETDEKKPIDASAVHIHTIFGIGRIEPENEIIQLSAEIGGLVQKVHKNENDTVKAGDLIIELKHTIEDANIKQLKEALAVQKAQIKVDDRAIKELKIRLKNESVQLQRLENLLAKGAETQQVVDNATAEIETTEANIQKSLAVVQVSNMKWQEAVAQVAIAQAQLNQLFIRAPFDGVILELTIQVGNYIDSKQIVAQINPEGKTIAVCEIDELFAAKIEVGQNASIRNFGALDTLSTGKVYFASAFLKRKSLFTDQPGEQEDRRVREIKIVLDQPANLLLNARVECVVYLSKNQN